MMRSGGQVVVQQLERHGVQRAFCVPGESYLAVLDALHDSTIDLVTCRHEGGAAYMAEAHGKLSGRPGVCLVTRGPGASNALIGVQTAWHDGTPLVLFVGLVPRANRYRHAFQEIDVESVFRSTAKHVEVIDDAARIPERIAVAFATACSGRPGPVVIGLPEDMLTDEVDVADADPFPVQDSEVSDRDMAALCRLLENAQQPLVVLGGSSWTSASVADVQSWAQRWELPVAVDFRCHDLIDNDSSSYVGVLGYGRDNRLARRLAAADVIVAIGSTLGDVPTDGYRLLGVPQPRARLVSVLPDRNASGLVIRPELIVDAAPPGFGRAVVGSHPSREPAWRQWTKAARADYLDFRDPSPDGDELDLVLVMQELRKRLPRDAVLTIGAGSYSLWVARILSHHAYPSLLAPRNGSMGYGVPAAVAAALAHPERRVVSIAGDGCFLMNGQEIAIAAARGLTPVIVVVNNASYGTIRRNQEDAYPGRVSGTALVNPDFAAYARAFGGYGEVVTATAQAGPALDRAFGAGTLAIVELRTSPRRLGPGRWV